MALVVFLAIRASSGLRYDIFTSVTGSGGSGGSGVQMVQMVQEVQLDEP
jgi:hypothetical protein